MTPLNVPNTLYCDDCRHVMPKLPEKSVDLIYIDPPFFTGKNWECSFGDEPQWFRDTWAGMDDFMLMMEEVLRNCHRLLKDTGSMYVHMDWHAVHYAKVMMDKIFERNNFRNEIIWHYHTGGASKSQFSKKHDTILLYTKTGSYTFNTQREPFREDRTNHFTEKDEAGREYRIRKVNGKEYKYYLDDGKICSDVWDISALNAVAKERLGYPTQKPEALLERIIKASSNKGDVVLDPMCGCGTCIAVADRLGRNFIGIDFSKLGCKVVAKRVRIPESDIFGFNVGMDSIMDMTPSEFQSWCCRELLAQRSKSDVHDMGIDGTLMDGTPIQVKQSDKVGRNVVDNFQSAIRRVRKDKGILVAHSFTRGTKNEVARLSLDEEICIKLVTTEELLEHGDKCAIFD